MNAYVLRCPITRASVLIDPGADPETLMEMLADTEPVAILLTHTHPDHMGALDEMCRRLAVPLLAHPGPHFEATTLDANRTIDTGDTITVGEHSLQVFHAPGHIADQVCLVLQDDVRVIVGDTIFDGGPGKTWSSEGFHTTLKTLSSLVLRWPDEMICYPGHGPHFRLGDRRTEIEAFLAKDHGDFFGDATWDM
jgi:glyoxylase-like metal-dependent hydrolase (beta-lactamase superfamily II)